jgi:hypothetical protein
MLYIMGCKWCAYTVFCYFTIRAEGLTDNEHHRLEYPNLRYTISTDISIPP